jgi:hypothetical protein
MLQGFGSRCRCLEMHLQLGFLVARRITWCQGLAIKDAFVMLLHQCSVCFWRGISWQKWKTHAQVLLESRPCYL